jgi:MFS family permease
MIAAGFVRNPRLHKPFLALGVALMGVGFLAAAASTSLVWVSVACGSAAAGFGLISTLAFSLFASLIPQGESGGYTALYYSLRAVASALAVPLVGLTIAATGLPLPVPSRRHGNASALLHSHSHRARKPRQT